jgi:hypothetical protein
MNNDYSMLQYTIPRKWAIALGNLVMWATVEEATKGWSKEEVDAFVETINCDAVYVGEAGSYPVPALCQMRGE